MRKSLIAITIILSLVCSIFPSFAFAAEFSGGVGYTNLTYTVDNAYSVVIPSAINLNENTIVPITTTDCAIGEGKQLIVAVDPERTFEDGKSLFLYSNKDTPDEKKMTCRIGVTSNANGSSANYIDMELTDDTTVAVFNNGSQNPVFKGYVVFAPITSGVKSGTYTGNVYFTISVRDTD